MSFEYDESACKFARRLAEKELSGFDKAMDEFKRLKTSGSKWHLKNTSDEPNRSRWVVQCLDYMGRPYEMGAERFSTKSRALNRAKFLSSYENTNVVFYEEHAFCKWEKSDA